MTWEENLWGCPSQLYCDVEQYGVKYTLYLRWRWDDPWTFSVIKNYPDFEVEDWLDVCKTVYWGVEHKEAEAWAEKWWRQNKCRIEEMFERQSKK